MLNKKCVIAIYIIFTFCSGQAAPLEGQLRFIIPENSLILPQEDPDAKTNGGFTYILNGIYFPAAERPEFDPSSSTESAYQNLPKEAVTLLASMCKANNDGDVEAYKSLCTQGAAMRIAAVASRNDLTVVYRESMKRRSKLKVIAVLNNSPVLGASDKTILIEYGSSDDTVSVVPLFISVAGNVWLLTTGSLNPSLVNLTSGIESHPELIQVGH